MNYRDQTICMMRVKSEARWIRRSLERTFEVCKTVVLFDDGSTDDTEKEAMGALYSRQKDIEENYQSMIVSFPWGWVAHTIDNAHVLHFLHSPFTSGVSRKNRVNEIRDKNSLWEYCKANLRFEYVLCLDGDEMLSRQAIRDWPLAMHLLKEDHADMLSIPFIYLWDREDQQRVDGIYGDLEDGIKQLRFPRLFTIIRCSEQTIYNMRFHWLGNPGGYHCGSVPREGFKRYDDSHPLGGTFQGHVIHFGYLEQSERQRKYKMYNEIDPHNEFEGEYKHVIGLPDRHAPGPVELVPYEDI